MKSTRSGDRNQTSGDRYILDRGYGLYRRGDRWLPDRWLIRAGVSTPPPIGHLLNGLAGYWTLDEASGTRMDSTANGNNLTATNNPVGATGIINNGAKFVAASAQMLSVVSNPTLVLAGTDFTIGCWINTVSTTETQPIVNKDGAVTREYDLLMQTDNVLIYTFAGTLDLAQSPIPIQANTWYYILAGYDTSQAKPFLSVNNGVTNLGAGGSTGAASGASDMQVGGRTAWGGNFDGVIDELGIWKRLLTAAEKASLYNNGAGRAFSTFTA